MKQRKAHFQYLYTRSVHCIKIQRNNRNNIQHLITMHRKIYTLFVSALPGIIRLGTLTTVDVPQIQESAIWLIPRHDKRQILSVCQVKITSENLKFSIQSTTLKRILFSMIIKPVAQMLLLGEGAGIYDRWVSCPGMSVGEYEASRASH